MKKEIIAVFDFDGTITTKDTLIKFITFTKGKWRLCGVFLFFIPLFIAMKLKLLPNGKVKQLLFSHLYKGTPVEIFNKWGIEFSAVIDKILCSKAIEALKSHKENGDKIVIVSASIENWIKPWADKRGINTVLSTQIEVNAQNRITGKFITKNCYGQEKVNRFLTLFPNRQDYKLVAYGDSRGDKEMLEFADNGFYKMKIVHTCIS